ncbi:hypothetical protein HYPSUDRAFT_77410 [Hypholoma sublateritium FD-334 SS-4]|uniref:Uncharacterized protein n=1 Tax=Hypholoma sublateritium (strain FD-334 SS-4) TaxID=945553 RepID=A0A0D2MFN8_HYPSF|nr:hypothetical protein HYPSUDRAFT_77410 [Hypholoma sublateritium FD-334 SS-4]
MQFTSLLAFTLAAFALGVGATPAPVNTHGGVVSLAEMKAWVDAQDPANITLVGDPFAALNNPLSQRADLETATVTFCSTLSGSVCTVPCTTITSGPACLNAPDTNCLFATAQVSFCDHGGCGGSCNEFDSCGRVLQDGFCATPGTNSIAIPA